MSPRSTVDTPPRPLEVAIVGNDAVLAALPARPMQLAHAVLACGYDLVVPVSWGEEVLAEHALRAISARGNAPAIFCACPSLRARLLSAGSELAPYLISVVAPSVATARYLRALDPNAPMRITLIGGCPSGRDATIDTRIGAHDFLRVLVNRGISLTRQPAVFDSVLPPDRRRFFSLPGGCPAPKALETRAPDRRLVTITDENFSTELAELLLGGENVLIDLSPRLGCTCCGGPPSGDHWGPSGRDEIIALEPPRAPTPVVELEIEVPVDVAPTDPVVPPEREVRAGRLGDAAVDRLRLPGAAPIGEARQRAERRRIAITPAAAMPAMPTAPVPPPMPPAVTPPPPPLPPARPVAAAPSPSASPDPSAPAVRAMRTPSATIARNPALSAPELLTQGVTPGTYADLANPPSAVTRSTDGGDTRTAHGGRVERTTAIPQVEAREVLISDDGPRPTPSSVAEESREPTDGRDSPVAAVPAVEPEVERARHRRAPSPRFLLSRAATHPRAQAHGGRILPRAYIRHTPTGMRAIDPLDALPDREQPLEVVVEPVTSVVVETTAIESTVQEWRAGASLAVGDIAVEPAAVEPAAVEPATAAVADRGDTVDASPATVAAGETASDVLAAPTHPGVAPGAHPSDANSADDARAMAGPPAAGAATAAGAQPAPSAPISDEVLARIRYQAQRHHAAHPHRIIARDIQPPRESRALGSLVRFVVVVVVVMALVVSLAVILRRAPTAPW